MRRWEFFGLALLLTALAACTPMVYGVPKSTWAGMSEPERLEAMHQYQQRQLAYEQARQERARQMAEKQARQRARQAEEERLRRERVAAIYAGRGLYGDLLRVTVQGGEVRIGGRSRHYRPVSFEVAKGESKPVTVFDSRGRKAEIEVSYDGGALLIDSCGSGSGSRGIRLVYDRGWQRGKTYGDVSSRGPGRLRGVRIDVEIVGKNAPPSRPSKPIVIMKPSPREDRMEPPRREYPPRAERRPPPQKPAAGNPSRRKTAESRRPEQSPPRTVGRTWEKAFSSSGGKGRKAPPATAPARIEVTILRGRYTWRGRQQPLRPVHFVLRAGETRKVKVAAPKGAAPLVVVYRDGVLYLDGNPANTRERKAISRLKFDPARAKGCVYHISTRGKLKIRDAEIEVKPFD